MRPSARKDILARFATLVTRNAQELAVMESLDSGKTIFDCETVDIPETIHCIKWRAEVSDKIYDQVAPASDDHIAMAVRVPIGVVRLVLPWNFPLLVLAWKIGPALATGCSVVVKPDAWPFVQRCKFDARFPRMAGMRMAHEWAGHLCRSLNGLAKCAEIAVGVFSSCVQNGLGTARGTLTGIAAAEMAYGVTCEMTRFFKGEATPKALPPEPFATLGANAYLHWKEWRAGAEQSGVVGRQKSGLGTRFRFLQCGSYLQEWPLSKKMRLVAACLRPYCAPQQNKNEQVTDMLKAAIRKLRGFSLLIGIGVFLIACNEDGSGPVSSVPAVAVSTSPSRIAITVDDLPYVTFGGASPEDGLRYAESITSALQEHGIVATGFVIGQNINAETRPALQAFADAGHTIGNHSWTHPDYGTITREEFLDETRRTDEALAEWIAAPRYYRFPYLRQSETAAKREAATQILTDLGYQNVPVTIDNDEWRYNAEYTEAIADGKSGAAAIIAQNYLAHMQERTSYFQTLAVEELGEDVDHILPVHLNRINADHLGTLLDWYDAQGWTFITVDDALAHPLFSRAELYEGPRGLSQIERVLGGQGD